MNLFRPLEPASNSAWLLERKEAWQEMLTLTIPDYPTDLTWGAGAKTNGNEWQWGL
jgi:hypothetical protein